MIRAEINKIETKKRTEKKKSVEQCWFFEKINKMINLKPDLHLTKDRKMSEEELHHTEK